MTSTFLVAMGFCRLPTVLGLAFAIAFSLTFYDVTTLEQAMNQVIGQQAFLYQPEEAVSNDPTITCWLPARVQPTGHNTTTFAHSYPSYQPLTTFMMKKGIKNTTVHEIIRETITTKSWFVSHLHTEFGASSQTEPYVHDAKYIQRHAAQFPFTIPPTEYGSVCAPPGMGPEGEFGYNVLTSALSIANVAADDSSTPTVFCAIYSYEGGKDRVQAILETWGKRCDGFMVASTFSDQSVGTIDLLHKGIPGDYDSMWQKVRSMLAYMYEHYLDDYDFFHIVGDDVFLIVENLKAYLSTVDPDEVLYAGGWTRPTWKPHLPDDFFYAGGGPGYTLSREALKQFVELALPTCFAKTMVSFEDLVMGLCMRFFLGVQPSDTVDKAIKQRYHGVDPQLASEFYRLYLRRGNAIRPRNEDILIGQFLSQQYEWQNKFRNRQQGMGVDSVSQESVAFHVVKSPAKMRRFEKLLYRKHVADCTCNGDNEPGRMVATTKLEGHKGCEWDYRYGSIWNIENCTSWQEQMKLRPPKC